MTKSTIYAIRAKVNSATQAAHDGKTPYSRLIRMEWKKFGYVPVSAYFTE